MKKILYVLALGCTVLLYSCSDFLEKTPVNEIGSNNFFTNESALKTYTNGFLSYVPDAATLGYGDGYCDIICTNASTTFLTTTQWTPSQQSGWSASNWKPISNVNYFLVHFKEVGGLTDETYNHYEGTARFWRAWLYVDFVKTFGAVPWYDKPLDADDEEALYKTRDSREYVMDKVLEDLNYACENILATSEWTNSQLVSKYVALAFKARVCLFEGTYRKYHTVDPSTGEPWTDSTAPQRFLQECVNACEELMNSGVYKLVDSGTDSGRQTQYRRLFTSESIDYTENIWAREYSSSMNVCHTLTWYFNSGSAGQKWCLTQDFVQTYLHHDGSRHAEVIAERQAAGEDVTLTTELFADEVNCDMDTNGRDYRLMQHIITPGYQKTSNGSLISFSPVFTTAITGYQIIKWNIDDTGYESLTNSYNSLPIFRYAEVLLNYAEAKAELGEFTQDVWDKTIKPIRERSGVDGTRRTDIDQTLADYYQITDCDLVEIRRERAIEMLLEDLRYDDLMRWHLGELLNVDWYGIYIPEKNVAYDIDGNGSYDVAVVNSSSEVISGVNNIICSDQYSLEDGDSGRIFYNIVRRFDEQRYLRPIPDTALNINPDLLQNYYWR